MVCQGCPQFKFKGEKKANPVLENVNFKVCTATDYCLEDFFPFYCKCL